MRLYDKVVRKSFQIRSKVNGLEYTFSQKLNCLYTLKHEIKPGCCPLLVEFVNELTIMRFRIFVESVEDHCMYLDFALIYIIVSQVYKNIQHNNINKIDLLFKVNLLNLELIHISMGLQHYVAPPSGCLCVFYQGLHLFYLSYAFLKLKLERSS